jgi:hypothetical protein
MPPATVEAIGIVALVGGFAGLVGGFFGGGRHLLGSILLGVIGGLTASTMLRIAGAAPIYGVGDGFSLVYAGVGGLLLGFVVGKTGG